MPHKYNYPEDGKFHTRYSELVKATETGVIRAVQERRGEMPPIENIHTLLGTERHEEFAKESLKTGKPAQVFLDGCSELNRDYKVATVEQELVAEIFPDVVLHSTPDFIGTDAKGNTILVDYKCSAASPDSFPKSKQHLCYAFQLLARGILCSEVYYCVEQWNTEKTEIMGYTTVVVPIDRQKIMAVRDWLWERVCNLQEALEIIK